MAFVEIAGATAAALGGAWRGGVAALAALALLSVPAVAARARALTTPVRRAVLVALIAAALLWAWRLAWVCDDAFISFRYADNWAHGRGLVWNPGERVEGYTNFLWTALIAGAIRSGLDPAQASVVLGLGTFAAELLVVARLSARLRPSDAPWRFPAAAVVLAFHYTFASFGTSGLETMAATLGATLAVERALARAPLAAGLAGVLAAMCHPDHAIFYAALAGALALDRERRRELVRYALPLLLVGAPWFFVRWAYYGHPFPNTYYAKSGAGAYFSQGLVYLWASFVAGGLWAAAPLVLVGWWRTRRELFGRYAAIALPLYLGYVAKVGGDYMYGRLVVVALPPLFLLAEVGAAHLAAARPWRAPLFWLAPLAIALMPISPIAPRRLRWHLADERTHTPLLSFAPVVVGSPMFARAQLLRERLTARGLTARLADVEIGMLGYYTGLPVIDYHGLTDATVAHQALGARGRPGHEKTATPGYLRERKVDLSRRPVFEGRYEPFTHVRMPDGLLYYQGRWRPDLMAALRDVPGFAFVDGTKVVDGYLAQASRLPPAQVAQDLRDFFAPWYFATDPDPARRARFDEAMRGQ